MKVVIVGGVAGGATAAARIRRLDEHAEIVIFERSGYMSYANCGLPYYIGGVIAEPEALTLQTPKKFWDRFRVAVRVRHEVTAIDRMAKTVSVRNLETGKVYAESYDRLLLSPGARPTLPPVPGVDLDRVMTLRTVEDTLRIRAFVEARRPKKAVLVGGGFINLEVAENLLDLGVAVTIVQRPKQLLAPLDPDMAALVHNLFREKGAKLKLGGNLTAFEAADNGVRAVLAGGETIAADMAVLAVGVTPDSHLAADAGLATGIKGSIVVDDHLATSDPAIYAVGDAVQVRHGVSGQSALIALAGPANRQARIAADNICGGDSRYDASWGSSVIKLFDRTVASTGLNAKTAEAAGIPWDQVVLSPNPHVTYYPGARPMTMKVIFAPDSGRVLGAQIVGFEGVDKRIDVLATAIQAGMTAAGLKALDLAYAPPYSSAKDPVNMAGFMIENLMTGKVKQYRIDDVAALPRDGSVTLLDTRTPEEYALGHVAGFINIPLDDLREHLGEIPAGCPVYVMCESGLRSYLACRILTQEGFDSRHLAGGYGFYAAVTAGTPAAQSAEDCGLVRG